MGLPSRVNSSYAPRGELVFSSSRASAERLAVSALFDRPAHRNRRRICALRRVQMQSPHCRRKQPRARTPHPQDASSPSFANCGRSAFAALWVCSKTVACCNALRCNGVCSGRWQSNVTRVAHCGPLGQPVAGVQGSRHGVPVPAQALRSASNALDSVRQRGPFGTGPERSARGRVRSTALGRRNQDNGRRLAWAR